MSSRSPLLLVLIILLSCWPLRPCAAVDDAFLAKLEHFRSSTGFQQREDVLAELQGYLAASPASDEERKFLLACVIVEISAKGPPQSPLRQARRELANRQLASIPLSYPHFIRHPYLLYLQMRFSPDVADPNYPSSELCDRILALFHERYLDSFHDPFPPQIDRSLGAMMCGILQARFKRDLRASRPELSEFEIMSGMQLLAQLQTLPTPAWLIVDRARGMKSIISLSGQPDRYHDTLLQLDNTIEWARHGNGAENKALLPMPPHMPQPHEETPAQDDTSRNSLFDRPWSTVLGALGLLLVVIAMSLGIRALVARSKGRQ